MLQNVGHRVLLVGHDASGTGAFGLRPALGVSITCPETPYKVERDVGSLDWKRRIDGKNAAFSTKSYPVLVPILK